ncbi:MAG: hypothetical protein KDB26_02865 [Microthrixaceae bacterium]|nr:hypothetical protein [Microthrixaceae bacterium]
MAKYDPQRPRRVASGEQSAQVDALLDPVDEVEVIEITEAHVADEPVVVEPVVNEPVVVDEALVAAIASESDVPVAPPPREGTANRAVLGAALAVIVAAVIGYLVSRRHRSAD